MRIVRETLTSSWIKSFECCNLHPGTRTDFGTFCLKIAGHLRAGTMFKGENVDAAPREKFALLPSFWHGMSSAER
jgi:hypothetical protein